MTSAVRTNASRCSPPIAAVERLDAEEDGLAQPELVDPADVAGGQRPVQVRRVAAGHDHVERDPCSASTSSGQPGSARPSSPVVGHDAALAGEVRRRARRARRRGSARGRRAPPRTSSSGTPSRRSPSSTMTTTECTGVGPAAARSTAARATASLCRLTSATSTTGADLAEHRRADQRCAARPSSPASRVEVLHPRITEAGRRRRASIAAPTPGEPSDGLGHPGHPDAPRASSRSTRTRVLCSTLARSTSSAKRHHRAWT